MKNLLSFRKGSHAAQDEIHLLEKIRVLAKRYAEDETALFLIVLAAYTKIPGPPRKLSRLLEMSPPDYSKALTTANDRLRENTAFNNLFHYIRTHAEDMDIPVPRFPAAAPQS